MDTTNISIGILIFLLITLIIYIIVIYESYKRQTFVFTPYTSPPPPSNAISMGDITQLTPDQIQQRNNYINELLGAQAA